MKETNPWYRKGLQFECKECGGCCSGAPGYVWLSEEEIENIATRLGLSVPDFEFRYVREVGNRKSLTEFPNGDCVFYDRFHTNCKIYRDRPAQCRTWPFWESNLESERTWEQASRSCKGCNRGRLYSFAEIEERKNIREL
ncbi:MAG: YkgJ family cysteine cluster protein [Planctomycetia bacterium]|nr:YkgJ family cysteine cluster protein [Planctomycetia bacterium]